MDAVRHSAAIEKIYDDGVADFGADDRPKNAQPLWLALSHGKSGIRIFNETSLSPPSPVSPGWRNGLSMQQIATTRSVIPCDIFGRDKVMACSGNAEGRRNGEE